MSMEFWQAGGIPPTVIRGGGNLEHWRAGGIPAMMATPTFSLTIQGAVHAHEFPSAFAAWWPSWFGSGGGGGGSASPPPPDPSLDFSLENNSGYIALIGGF